MTQEEFNKLKQLANRAAKRLAIRLTPEQVHDVATELWMATCRYDVEMKDAAPRHIKNAMAMRARGAVIDQVRFATWATRGKGPMRLAPIEALTHFTVSDDQSPEAIYSRKEQLALSKNGAMIREYAEGTTMKQIGAARGLSEARISQAMKEFKLYE